MMYSEIRKAIQLTLMGSAFLGGTASAGTTMYNLTTGAGVDFSGNTTACAPCFGPTGISVDGFVWGVDSAGIVAGAPAGSTNSVAKWAGTGGLYTTPFGYNGGAVLNWAISLAGPGDSAVVSSQDAVDRYGFGADIDVAQGAWSDLAMAGAAGRRHDLDLGLFRSDISTTVTLHAEGVNLADSHYGFTIFKGMDHSTVGYNHYGNWNTGNNSAGPGVASLLQGNSNFDPDGAGPLTGVDAIVAYSIGSATPSNINDISFFAEAGQVYTIIIGGYRDGPWVSTVDGYTLSATAVPVPGAVWLMGSALVGLARLRRRSQE